MRPERLYLSDIVEAAARLPEEFKSRHPAVPWADVAAFRNIAVHEYFAVDWTIVWNAAVTDAPDLRRSVARILQSEFGDGGGDATP